MNRSILIHRLTGPAILLLLGIVALLAQAHVVHFFGVFVPLLLIMLGVLKLAERMALSEYDYPGPQGPGAPPYGGAPYPPPYGAPTYTASGPASTSPTSTSIVPTHDFGNQQRHRGRKAMSTMPPNPPGGMPPYPPYDPKTQWRVYREQQKAAWRAQRDAMRAQRQAWKSGYWGVPHVPSVVGPLILIAIGVIWLLIYSGHVPAQQFWNWYGHWWPLVLIVAGLAMLGEWMLDMRRSTPVHRRGSFVGILILVVFLGVCASAVNNWGWVGGLWSGNNGGFFNMLGMPEHDMDQPLLSEQIPANAAVQIKVPLGDVSVTAGDGPGIQVQAHAVAYAGSDAEAHKILEAEKATITVNGDSVLVTAQSKDHGRVNLAVTVPKSARVTVNSAWNDVTASGLGAGINVTARGDIHLNSITGPVEVHFINGRHNDISIHQADGDIKLEGDCNDLTLSDIKGRVTQNGQLEGDVHIENVSGGVHLHTSVTDVEIAALPGDMTLDSDDLRVNEATGAVHVVTHAKDVDLNQIYGDTSVQDRDGTISVEPAGPLGSRRATARATSRLPCHPTHREP